MESLNEKRERALKIIKTLRIATKNMPRPMSELISKNYDNDPFLILISCLLSLRARDIMTYPVCIELFKVAKTPEEIVQLPRANLEKIIHSLGFYKNKARTLQQVSQELIERFKGKVPSTYQELISIKGIGPKTANLVLGIAFNIPAICVDVHVHRISNRLGLVHTKTPEQTEAALKKILPQQYWIEYNSLLVMWGQNMCVPGAPFCSRCPIYDLCKRVAVKKMR